MGLETLAIAAIAGSQIYGGIAAEQEGKSQQAIQNYNAAVMEQQAKATEQKTAFEQKRQAEAAERQASKLQAGLGAAGAVTTTGTPLLIQAKQASELELENLMIGYEGATEAARARSEAAGYKMQGKLVRQRGRAEMIGGFMGAGGTLLTGFSKSPKFQAVESGVPFGSAMTATRRTTSGGYVFGR
jgi:hypothetical protein